MHLSAKIELEESEAHNKNELWQTASSIKGIAVSRPGYQLAL